MSDATERTVADATAEANAKMLDEFPPVEHAFAYGSAVFAQRGYTKQQKRSAMTDLVFAVHDSPARAHIFPHSTRFGAAQVRDPYAWHRENMQRHRAHYSALALLGPAAITAVQEQFGAGVYFNTLVPVRGRLIKYGVVSRCAPCCTHRRATARSPRRAARAARRCTTTCSTGPRCT
jgi:translocator assembly and maintenance protein 41